MELIRDDLHFVVSRLPKDLLPLMKAHRPMFVAGGFIRATIAGERINDIDVFADSKDRLSMLSKELTLLRRGRWHETDNAFTVIAPPRKPVQFIHRWLYDDAARLCDSFDFTIAQAVVWWEGDCWRSVASDRFYADLAARRLTYTAPIRNEDAGGSLLRARKFLMAGYNIQAPSLAAVIARLTSGVRDTMVSDGEAGMARVLTGLLREVDPLTVVDGIDMVVNEHQSVDAVEF